MDALKLLEQDHRLVEQILDEGERTTERGEKTRTELFARLKRELTIHESMEEQVLYAALREVSRARDIALDVGRQVQGRQGEPRAPPPGRRNREVAGRSKSLFTGRARSHGQADDGDQASRPAVAAALVGVDRLKRESEFGAALGSLGGPN